MYLCYKYFKSSDWLIVWCFMLFWQYFIHITAAIIIEKWSVLWVLIKFPRQLLRACSSCIDGIMGQVMTSSWLVKWRKPGNVRTIDNLGEWSSSCCLQHHYYSLKIYCWQRRHILKEENYALLLFFLHPKPLRSSVSCLLESCSG